MSKYKYNWTLKDAKFTKNKGTVFSCFSCGGGSTMGYKLAGFDVIGCNEIDPKMMDVYKLNHNPKYSYLESIETFKNRSDLPDELYNLDILDGSPPCSSFSMAGNREKDWGKKKIFREGQKKQVLDKLFFDFIELAKKLQPKIVIAENVKGLLLGNAFKYVQRIYDEFDKAGYYCQHWLLNASNMGVPQQRERVFFICLRKDIAKPFLYQKDLFDICPKLDLEFNIQSILFNEIDEGNVNRKKITSKYHLKLLENVNNTGRCSTITQSKNYKMDTCGFLVCVSRKHTPYTIKAKENGVAYHDKKHYITDNETCLIGSYPTDYKFNNIQVMYLVGMSVPPVMMAQISNQVYKQWLVHLQ